MTSPSDGLNISTTVSTLCSSSVAFITEAFTATRSPVRRNRGRLGCTMISLDAKISLENVAERSESVNATARNPHVVFALGTVNFNASFPSLPVTSDGLKNASDTSDSLYENDSFSLTVTSSLCSLTAPTSS